MYHQLSRKHGWRLLQHNIFQSKFFFPKLTTKETCGFDTCEVLKVVQLIWCSLQISSAISRFWKQFQTQQLEHNLQFCCKSTKWVQYQCSIWSLNCRIGLKSHSGIQSKTCSKMGVVSSLVWLVTNKSRSQQNLQNGPYTLYWIKLQQLHPYPLIWASRSSYHIQMVLNCFLTLTHNHRKWASIRWEIAYNQTPKPFSIVDL
jgi:hypothetical protein